METEDAARLTKLLDDIEQLKARLERLEHVIHVVEELKVMVKSHDADERMFWARFDAKLEAVVRGLETFGENTRDD